jgi:hypothetical protein
MLPPKTVLRKNTKVNATTLIDSNTEKVRKPVVKNDRMRPRFVSSFIFFPAVATLYR